MPIEDNLSAEVETVSLKVSLGYGDGEVALERHLDMGRAILDTRIGELDLPAAVTLPVHATVARALEVMRKKDIGAVVVVERGRRRRVAGIFTERDLVARVLDRRGYARLPLGKVMTTAPETLRPRDSLAHALSKMSLGRFRHVPVVDDVGTLLAMLSIREVMNFLAEIIPEAALRLRAHPGLTMAGAADAH
jgi:CBS domain-containing protein